MKPKQVKQLERLARLRSDLQMRRFSAFRAHVETAKDQIRQLEGEMAAIFDGTQEFSVASARLTNVMAGDCSRSLIRAEQNLQQLLPGYEAARQEAIREFGRAEVLTKIGHDLVEDARQKLNRKAGT